MSDSNRPHPDPSDEPTTDERVWCLSDAGHHVLLFGPVRQGKCIAWDADAMAGSVAGVPASPREQR